MHLRKTFGLAVVGLSVMMTGAAFAESYIVVGQKWGNTQNRAIQKLGGKVSWSHGPTGLAVVESDAQGFLDKVRANKAFKDAALDEVIQWQGPVNNVEASAIDPGLESLYPLQWHLPAVNAEEAWDKGCTGAGVRVAILDGGIYDLHPDLAPNLDVEASASMVPGYDFNEDTGPFWHGTHVAGIVAAANSGTGVLGVAPEATIIGVKVLHDGSGSFGGILEGILYAVDEADADIINMSLGGAFAKRGGGGSFLAVINRVVNYATRNGVLVVSAAGNDGLNWDHSRDFVAVPAEAGNGIAVSATGPIGWAATGNMDFDRPSSFTSHGQSLVHVSAPGGDFAYPGNEACLFGIPCWAFDMVLSTNVGGGYTWSAGTSMASPMAAGVAALIKANHPDISVGALKSALAQTTLDAGKPGHDVFHGRGWVNALKACNY